MTNDLSAEILVTRNVGVLVKNLSMLYWLSLLYKAQVSRENGL